MGLILRHPDLIQRTCASCRTWMYQDGKELSGKRMERRGEPVARLPGIPTPCHKCPKINAVIGQRVDREIHRIAQAMHTHNVAKATGGRGLPQHLAEDEIVCRNLGIIESVMSDYNTGRAAELLLPILVGVVAR